VLENPSIKKIGQNIKYDVLVLRHYGIRVKGIAFDAMIASYLLNPGKPSHRLDAIALEYLNHKTITYAEVTGTGKKQIGFSAVDVQTATRYSAEDADIALRLKNVLAPLLKEHNLEDLFVDMEMPLMEVLAEMERIGVKIDADFLKTMSKKLGTDMAAIERSIYELAGEEFNINSPKQLSEILFTKLKLTPLKRTKTGFSTNVDVLEELAPIHPLPAEILRYRTLAKLKSTYVDALPLMINPKTGRLHTSFNQTVTATGRLSSSDPNLQNIPIRTEEGREIRQAFIAESGSSLISADYSQIELRVLAHMSNDSALIQTFQREEDVHTRTASEIFGLPPDEITLEMRRKAKAVNFGIIYGISAFGLAQDIGVSNAEAKRYIDNYFARYPGVRSFLDKTIEDATTNGYVTTLFGRRRFIPELASSTVAVRNFGERMAVNTPIQGTAADLIKLAMIRIHARLGKQGLRSTMIIQVHDELVFEVPDNEIAVMKGLVKDEMEHVLSLSVPIKVDMGVGKNWDEAH
jgi:DNA polymerase I